MNQAALLGIDANVWIAVATVVNAICVIVLLCVTVWYARSAKRQAKASEEQANATREQAEAATEGIRALRQQNVVARAMGWTSTKIAIENSERYVAYWLARLMGEGYPRFPSGEIRLAPANADLAAEYAQRVAPELALKLAEALQTLELARTDLEILRGTDYQFPQVWQGPKQQAVMRLGEGKKQLSEAKRLMMQSLTASPGDLIEKT